LAIGPFEFHAPRRELVDVWTFHDRITVATEIAIQIVRNEKKHVPFRLLCCVEAQRHGDERKEEQWFHGGRFIRLRDLRKTILDSS
jgi:hypothetical protein